MNEPSRSYNIENYITDAEFALSFLFCFIEQECKTDEAIIHCLRLLAKELNVENEIENFIENELEDVCSDE